MNSRTRPPRTNNVTHSVLSASVRTFQSTTSSPLALQSALVTDRTVVRPPHPAEAALTAPWIERTAEYWPGRTVHVLQRLQRDWKEHPEHDKWPDASALLDLLAAPPDAVIRQLPAAAREAIALCDNPGLSRVDLAAKLSRDPSLVQGLLRQANGAYYGAGFSAVLGVGAAIDRVGISATRAIVLASCVDGLLSKPGGAYDAMLSSV